MPYAPDLLLVNANVITMDPARPRAATVAVASGRIAGVGDDAAETVTAEEALRAYTWGSAYASKAEHVEGSIEVGKLADFTVLSEDPAAVSPSRIAGLEVIATILDGKLRHSALD